MGCITMIGVSEDNKELEASYKDQDNGYACESSVSLKFLAGATKRTYPRPPSDHCIQSQSPLRKTVGPQDGGAAGLNSKKQHHHLALSIKCTLKLYLENKKLTKDVEIPGTSSDCRVSTVARMETRLLLRRSAKALYKLHRSGKCLDGAFTLNNFLLDDDMFVHLDYKEESAKDFSKLGAKNDFKQFVRTVKDDIFASEDIPQEILKWLSLIERQARGYEYLICYHSSLMEHHQTLNTFFSLYHTLQLMQQRDRAGYLFVLDQLERFDGWTVFDLHNKYFFDTYLGRDLSKTHQVQYGTDVMSLLRLIRNTFQHITLKTMDDSGNITFGPEEFEYILHDQFPDLIAELMEAMFVAGYLSDLNLEHQMC